MLGAQVKVPYPLSWNVSTIGTDAIAEGISKVVPKPDRDVEKIKYLLAGTPCK